MNKAVTLVLVLLMLCACNAHTEPAKFGMNGEISLGFASTGYLDTNVKERLSEFYDGYFGEYNY